MRSLNLAGKWHVRSVDDQAAMPATVPGCIHTDLMAAGRIPDPFFRDNEEHVQWVSEKTWIYSRQFRVSRALLKHRRILLRAEGLDTLAHVRINGRELAFTDNAFRTWEFDVRDAIHDGLNTLEIQFDPVAPYVREQEKQRVLPGWLLRQLTSRAYVRKSPCNFGWDWGPGLITCGIWRAIRIVAYDRARLTHAPIRQDHAEGRVRLSVTACVEDDVPQRPPSPSATAVAEDSRGAASILTAQIALSFKGKAVASTAAAVAGGRAEAELTVDNPRLWWPNGMGGQPLYDLDITLLDAAGKTLDRQSRRIGLRTLRLVRERDAWGESFHFAANGVPFFAKGGNWIPADALVTRITRERYADLISSMATAHMNMVRLWGGGIYEDDCFYELCDEQGICVWHDFMFACSTYPTFQGRFMASVEAEFRDNIRRVAHHPCIALWCGNNELEQGLVGDSWSSHTMSWEDYGLLFDRLLPRVVKEEDPQRDYWPCSPHTPLGNRRNFNDPTCGDAHLWDVWHGRKPFEWYRTCAHRFNSEFGFQSFPEPRTMDTVLAPEDRNITSYVMDYHQRSGIGNTVIMQYMLDWFRLPAGYENTVWASQILQGMAIKYAVEHWRRSMPRGMGTLYWQINDTWPGPSWSSVDYFGRWKALHYMACRFYAPLLVSGLEDTDAGTVEIHVTSDMLRPVAGKVRWELTTAGGKRLAGGSAGVRAEARRDITVRTLDLKKYIERNGTHDLLLWLNLSVRGETVSTNLVSFARPKYLNLESPRINLEVKPHAEGALQVILTSRAPALWAWLELDGQDMMLSDNFVHLRPGRPAEILAMAEQSLSPAQFRKRLRVRSLYDTYQERQG